MKLVSQKIKIISKSKSKRHNHSPALFLCLKIENTNNFKESENQKK